MVTKRIIRDAKKHMLNLGEMINIIKDINKTLKLNLPKDWFNNADDLRKLRNKYFHGFFLENSIVKETKSADKIEAEEIFENTINLISELQLRLKIYLKSSEE